MSVAWWRRFSLAIFNNEICVKMPRAAKPTGKTRHDPLLVQLKEDEFHEKYGKVSQPGKRKKTKHSDEDEGDEVRGY